MMTPSWKLLGPLETANGTLLFGVSTAMWQLAGQARVPESAITVFDSSRWIPGNLYDKTHHEFPGVVFVDHIGGDGRLKAEFMLGPA